MSPKFPLQNVLDLRHGKVEIFEIELGKLLAIRQETETLLTSLEEVRSSLLDQLGEAQCGDLDLIQLNLLRLNVLQVGQHIDMLALELKKQDAEIEAKRNELVQAKQSEETLKILKQKRHELYVAEQVQIEAQVQDDIYIARAFRNQRQGA